MRIRSGRGDSNGVKLGLQPTWAGSNAPHSGTAALQSGWSLPGPKPFLVTVEGSVSCGMQPAPAPRPSAWNSSCASLPALVTGQASSRWGRCLQVSCLEVQQAVKVAPVPQVTLHSLTHRSQEALRSLPVVLRATRPATLTHLSVLLT